MSLRGVRLHSSEIGVLTNAAGRTVSVQKFTWKTDAGLKLSVLNLDAAIIELCVPDRTSQSSANVLLGVDTLDEYLQLDPALVCAAHLEYPWPRLSSKHPQGDLSRVVGQRRVWLPFVDETRLQLSLEQSSRQPNKPIIATITINVEPSNVVRIQYRTSCAAGGLFRLSHSFLFNLAGRDAGPSGTYEHVVQLNADSYVDEKRFLRLAPENLADLRIAQHIGLILSNARNEEKRDASGLCGIYSLNNASEEGFGVRLIHSGSGRAMELYCDFPWLHFSTLDHLTKGRDVITPFYGQNKIHRLSLVFDIDRFVVSIVDAIENGSPGDAAENVAHNKGQDDQNSKNNQRSEKAPEVHERFVHNAGLLLHPLACPFKVKRDEHVANTTGSQSKGQRASRCLTFCGHVTLKFGICSTMPTHSAKPVLRPINRSGTMNSI